MVKTCLIAMSACAALAVAAPQAAAAAGGPITLVVPFGPGGVPDIIARFIQPKLAEYLGQQVVVENKPGAGGNLGSSFAARAKADGSVILLGTINTLSMNKWIYGKLDYDPEALTPIIQLGTSPSVILANRRTGIATLKDIVALGKKQAGKPSYATPGVGTAPHLTGELINREMDISMLHIPYKSSPDAIADLVGGRVDMLITNLASVPAMLKNENLVAVAITSPQRHPLFPQLPTLSEAGLGDISVVPWVGLVAPPKTDPAVVQRIFEAADKTLKDPGVAERMKTLGFTPSGSGPADFSAFIAEENRRWKAVVKEAGISAD